MATPDEKTAEGVDEGALADPWDARDADPLRPPGERKELVEKGLGEDLVFGSSALDERDRPSQRGSVAGAERLGESRRVRAMAPSGSPAHR
jgi:hypothetical protein